MPPKIKPQSQGKDEVTGITEPGSSSEGKTRG